jgi:hypothetical protein
MKRPRRCEALPAQRQRAVKKTKLTSGLLADAGGYWRDLVFICGEPLNFRLAHVIVAVYFGAVNIPFLDLLGHPMPVFSQAISGGFDG